MVTFIQKRGNPQQLDLAVSIEKKKMFYMFYYGMQDQFES